MPAKSTPSSKRGSHERTTIYRQPRAGKSRHAPTGDDVLVVAGAGSGKTYTMTRRIINLIAQGVPAERILGLTFTRKAASELLSRVFVARAGGRGRRALCEPGVPQAGGVDVRCVLPDHRAAIRPACRLRREHAAAQPGRCHTAGDHRCRPSHGHPLRAGSRGVQDRGEWGTGVVACHRQRHDRWQHNNDGRGHRPCAAWDHAFLAQLDIAIGDTPVPDEAPKAKVPTKNKKDTEETFAAKQEEYRAQLRDICVYKCAQLRDVTRRRETLLTLVEEYEAGKAGSEHGGISRFHHCRLPARRAIPLHRGERYRRRYTHVLLDEYQDTSTTRASAPRHPVPPPVG